MILYRKLFVLPGKRAFYLFAVCFLLLPFLSEAQSPAADWSMLWGSDTGLFSRNQAGRVETLWSGGRVLKIIQSGSAWTILTDQGIFASANSGNWEQRNQGLPQKVIKVYEGGQKSFINMVQQIKDLEIDPVHPEIMVSAIKDAVFLSRNGGRSWQNLGMPNFRANGIKAVAAATLPGVGLTLFCAHSIYGVYYIHPGQDGARWTEISGGFELLETTNNPDEISDIIVIPDPSGRNAPEIYASQSFRRRIYRLDWNSKTWNLLWSDTSAAFGGVDSLSPGSNSLVFVRDGGIMELGPLGGTAARPPARLRQDLLSQIRSIRADRMPNCIVLRNPAGQAQGTVAANLSELWLLEEIIPWNPPPGSRLAMANNMEGLYLPVNHAMDPQRLRRHLDLMKERGLNMLVIDMKDDYGRLRFTPQNSSMLNLGRVFQPVDIDAFLRTMKEQGIFTVARIVVFKDPEAAARENARYAVWDGANNQPWQGYYDVRVRKGQEPPARSSALTTAMLPSDDPDYEILRTWYDEKWVDPYSEVIWDYNASVAEELCRRGFDEIQFDYIRFPTDGINLRDARYRWRDQGMDMDSAILSFLRHARSRVTAPISIDIYGANGWYRTGARTGQEVELFAPWVDVICPMYYPSHFEQHFLAQDPPEQRPYRIYFQGTLRTRYIARGRVVVRSWAQSFRLNVSYDRNFYGPEYVLRQVQGTRAAGTGGITYWNNIGRYDEIPVP